MKKADLCVSLDGPLVGALLPMFVKSLEDVNNMDRIQLRFVGRDMSQAVRDWISDAGYGYVHDQNRPPPASPADVPAHVADGCSKMIRYCGFEDIVVICHLDVMFRRNLIDQYFDAMFVDNQIAQMGSHNCGVVAYRRHAVELCGVDFLPYSGFSLRDEIANGENSGRWKLRHNDDPRPYGQSFPVSGFDVGELLELCLRAKGYKVITQNDAQLEPMRLHLSNGSCHGGGVEQKRAQAMRILNEMGLEPIE